MTDKMLTLSPENKIGSGHQRHCYKHPEDTTKCIKILRERESAPKHQKLELYFYGKYKKAIEGSKHIPDYHGTVETNLGQGYLFDRVCDADGETSGSLKSYLEEECLELKVIEKELALLAAFFMKDLIICRDFNESNTVVQKQADGSICLVLIDGLGDRARFSPDNLLRFFVQNKIRRRWNKQLSKICKKTPNLDYTKVSL